MRSRKRLYLTLSALAFSACGGSGGSSSPVVAPPPPLPVTTDFSPLGAELERASIPTGAIMIGDRSGVLYRYEKGGFDLDDPINVASAAKLVSGLGLWSLVEDGTLDLDQPLGDILPDWSDGPEDPRGDVTLSQLGAFTSGFNAPPGGQGCHGKSNFTLAECVEIIREGGTAYRPGRVYSYGPDHLTVAAHTAKSVTERELSETVTDVLFTPAGASARTTYDTTVGDNIRYSGGPGGLIATSEDYARILTALLDDRLLDDRQAWLSDRTEDAVFASRFPTLEELGLDWHYGFGFFLECDDVPFSADCAANPTISSPGGRGFTPWVDFEAGYWGIVAVDEPSITVPKPTLESIRLAQTLQPLVEDILP